MSARMIDMMPGMAGRLVRRAPLWVLLALAALLFGLVTALAAVVDWPQDRQNSQHTGVAGDNANGFAAPDETSLRWSLKTGGAVRAGAAVVHRTAAYRRYLLTAASSGKTLAVASPELFAVGDRLTLTSGAVVENAVVAVVNGASLTLAATLANTFPAGATVDVTGVSVKLAVAATAAALSVTVDHPERFVAGDDVVVTDGVTGVTRRLTAVSTKYGTLSFAAALGIAPAAGNPVTVATAPADPFLLSDIAYLGSDDGHLYAVDPSYGRVFWRTAADNRLGAVRGAPAVDMTRARVYVASLPGRIFAFDLDGEFRWMYPPKTEPALGPIAGAPVVAADGRVYFAAGGGTRLADGSYQRAGIYAIDPAHVTDAGYAPLRFGLPAGELPGGLALYQLDGGALRVLFGVRAGDPMVDWLTADAAADNAGKARIYVGHPERFIPGDRLRLLRRDAPGTTQLVTVASVDASAGALNLVELAGVIDGFQTGSLVEPESVVGDALTAAAAAGATTLTVSDPARFASGNRLRLLSDDRATSEYVTVTAVSADPLVKTITVSPALSSAYPIRSICHIVGAGHLYSLDDTLAKKWTYPENGIAAQKPVVGSIAAAPVVDLNGFIYFGDTAADPAAASRGHLYCVKEETDTVSAASRWSIGGAGVADYALPVLYPVTQPAAVTAAGDALYLADAPVAQPGSLYLVNPAPNPLDGSVAVTRLALPGDTVADAPLTLDAAGRVLIATRQGRVHALTPPAAFVGWTTPPEMGFPLRTAPTPWEGGGVRVLIVGDDGGTVYGFGPTLGGGAGATPELALWGPGALWPFFHRDARRQGSLFDDLLLEPGPQDPTLRWFAAAGALPLRTSPVITDRTPDGRDRAYVGTQDGRLCAYDALNGTLLWQYPPATSAALAPIVATPAVNRDGLVAVAALDGRVYLVDPFGALKRAIAVRDAEGLGGNVLASPVFSEDGALLYAATADNDAAQGTFARTGTGAIASLTDGILDAGGITLNKTQTITYTVADAAKAMMLAHLRLFTRDAGTLTVYAAAADTEPILRRQYDAVAAARWIDLDVMLDARRIVWTSDADAAVVSEFLLTFNGAAETLDISGMLVDADTDAAINPVPPYTPAKVEARLATPVLMKSVSVQTLAAYTLVVTDANGAEYTWKSEVEKTDAAAVDTIAIERMVRRIRWERTAGADTLHAFTAVRRNVAGVGRVLAFATATGALTWRYPDPADAAQAPLAAITSSPAATASGIVYAASKVGQLVAVKDAGLAPPAVRADLVWGAHSFAPFLASPVLAPNGGRVDLYLADADGGMHFYRGDAGSELPGWPLRLAVGFSQSAAVTGNRHAFQLTDNGQVFLLNLAADLRGPAFSTVPANTHDGSVWTDAQSIVPGEHAVTVVGRLLPGFAATPTGTEEVRFGFRAGTKSYVVALGGDRRLLVKDSDSHATAALTLPAASDLSAGIELALSFTSTGLDTARVVGWYRLPDAAGNYAGSFIGTAALSVSGVAGIAVQPYLQAFDAAADPGAIAGYTASVGQVAVYRDAAPVAAASAVGPLAGWVNTLPTAVYSAPVIDSAGRIYVGSDAGAVFCLAPGGAAVAWKYLPDRSSISTTLTQLVPAGGTAPLTLSVNSTAGFVAGDALIVSRPDGSVQDALGSLLSISPPPNPTTSLAVNGPQDDGAGRLRKFTVTSVSGIAVGDDISIQAGYDGQILTYLGKVIAIDDVANTVVVDRDIDHAVITGQAASDGVNNRLTFAAPGTPAGVVEHMLCYLAADPATVYAVQTVNADNTTVVLATTPPAGAAATWVFIPYPVGSQVTVGSLAGTLVVSRAPARWHDLGDVVSVLRGRALPIRTAPAVGPSQTVYVGADDGIVYAIGPRGPAGIPAELPPLPPVETEKVTWNTFHADNQRTGFVSLPGPITNQLRWYTDTGSTLESSPALGFADETAPLGVLYAGACDEPGAGPWSQPQGSLIAYNASSGQLRWRFNDEGKMGRIFSSPTVFAIDRTDANGGALQDEAVVVGAIDMPQTLASVQLAAGIGRGAAVTSLAVTDATDFRPGMQVYVSDPDSGANFEDFGIVQAVAGNTLFFSPANVLLTGGRKQDGTSVASLTAGDVITALNVTSSSGFSSGMLVVVSDPGTGDHQESFGIVQNVSGNTLVISPHTVVFSHAVNSQVAGAHVVTRDHVAGSRVTVQQSQGGHVYCIDRAGALRWKFPADGAPAADRIGAIHSSPVVDGQGITYIGTDDGMVLAINPDGAERWRYLFSLNDAKLVGLPQSERVGVPEITSSPALNTDGSRLYIGVSVPDANRGYLVALDTTADNDDRRVRWISWGNDPDHRLRPLTASPAVSTIFGHDRIFIGEDTLQSADPDTARYFYAFDPDTGDVLDRITTKVDAADTGAICSTAAITPESSATVTDATIAADRVTVSVGNEFGILAGMRVRLSAGGFDAQVRTVQAIAGKTVTLDQPLVDPAGLNWTTAKEVKLVTLEQTILVGTLDGNLLAFAYDDTRIFGARFLPLWHSQLARAGIRTSPAVTVYDDALSNARIYTVYFGANDYYLYALEFNGGKVLPAPRLRWAKYLRDRVYASPVVGMRTYAGGRAILYQASRDHYMYAFGDRTNYEGPSTNPEGPTGPPPTDPSKQLVPSTLELSKSVERIAEIDPANPCNAIADPNAKLSWWRFIVTVRDAGRGVVDHVRLYDALPDSIATQVPPVLVTYNPAADDAPGFVVNPSEVWKISRPLTFLPAVSRAAELNDLASVGTYAGAVARDFWVKIAVAGAIDQFTWAAVPTGTLPAPGDWQPALAVTGGLQSLQDGVKIQFESRTGHTGPTGLAPDGSMWKFTADPDKPAWEIMWTSNKASDLAKNVYPDETDLFPASKLGAGFAFVEDLKDPVQQSDAILYQRKFTFYVKVRESKDVYDPDVVLDPGVERPKLSVTNSAMTGRLPEIPLGGYLKLKVDDFPVPNGTQGLNQLTAEGRTYAGDYQHVAPVTAHRETPVQSDWTDDFKIRIYYNGYADGDGKLIKYGNRASVANPDDPNGWLVFSPWNQFDPDTVNEIPAKRRPLFTVKQYENYKIDANTKMIRDILLQPSMKNFAFSSTADDRASWLTVMPYAWRVTVQQVKSRLNGQPVYSKEIGLRVHETGAVPETTPDFIIPNPLALESGDQPLLAVTAKASLDSGSLSVTNVLADFRNNVKPVRPCWVLIDNPVLPDAVAYATGLTTTVNPMVLTLAQTVNVEAGAKIYAMTRDVALGDSFLPGHTASSPTVRLANTSRWGMQQNTIYLTQRADISPGDLRHPAPVDWNADLTALAAAGYPFGAAPDAGPLWDGFRYDPYRENNILLRRLNFDLAADAGALGAGQGVDIHVTRPVPFHQPETANGGQYRTSTAGLDTFVYYDLNGSGSWDAGEPYYALYPDGAADPLAVALANPLEMKLGVTGAAGLRLSKPLFDMGRYPLAGGFAAIPNSASVENPGNRRLQVTGVDVYSQLQVTDGSVANGLQPNLLPTGRAGMKYTGGVVALRPENEVLPLKLETGAPTGWYVLKSPAGAGVDYERPFNFNLLGTSFRQPTGTYAGLLRVSGNDGLYYDTVLNMRISERRFSLLENPRPSGDRRPAFDVSMLAAQPWANYRWTNYLTGAESWPVAAELPGFPGDLGVFVASNTPQVEILSAAESLLPRLDPAAPGGPTDTNIWFRRAKHETLKPSAINGSTAPAVPVAVTSITLAAGKAAAVVDAQTLAVAGKDRNAADLVILRNTDVDPGQIPDAWYGYVAAKAGDVLTVAGLSGSAWNHAFADTVVELSAHPWVPVIDTATMNLLRGKMRDPGVAGDTGPHPIRCVTPSLSVNGNDSWLVWSASGVRGITRGGKTDRVPFAFLWYKQFDPANPSGGASYWVAPSGTPAANAALPLTVREKPVLLPGVNGAGMVLYEGGVDGNRGLYYAWTADVLATPGNPAYAPNWTIDLPLGALNSCFTNAGSPRAWTDASGGLDLIFQGRRADGNIDLYYARLLVDTATHALSFAPRTALVTESGLVPNADKMVYTGDLGWDFRAAGSSIKINNGAVTLTLPAETELQKQVFQVSGGAYLLQVDRMRGAITVLKGSVTEIALKGIPLLQRLTANLAADINPTVSIETYRYRDAGGNPVDDNHLAEKPRVWLFWTRQYADGLGGRIVSRTFRLDAAAARLGDDAYAGDPNVDMSEHLLPAEILGQDGMASVTRQADTAGLWVLSTAARSLSPAYPKILLGVNERYLPAQQDLFLQVLNRPVPDN